MIGVNSEEILSGWAPVGCLNYLSPPPPPPFWDPVTVLSSLKLFCSCMFFSSSMALTASLPFVFTVDLLPDLKVLCQLCYLCFELLWLH